MNNEATRAQLRRVPLAGALTVALLGAGALSVFAPTAPAASAAEVNGIITSANVTNEFSPNGPNRLWDSFSADLTFDTTGKSVKQGDTLTIDLPAELRTRNATFDVTDKKTGGVALNCTVPFGLGQTVTCTFTDYVNTHVNAKGDIHVRADMASTTTDASLTFKINHKVEIKADIPNGNVVVNKESWVPPSPWKYGWQLHDGHNERFTWEIHIPAKSIQAPVISVTDTFDTSHGGYKLFNDPSSDPNAWQRTRLLKWNSTETSTGFVASFPNSNDDAIYELKYYTELKSPEGLKIGNSFNNTADVNGLTAKKEIEVETVGWGNVEGQLRTTPPTPTTTTPPATTVTPSPSVSTTEATPSPSTSTTPSPKTPLARTGVMTAPAIGLGVLGLALGAALMRRRQQA